MEVEQCLQFSIIFFERRSVNILMPQKHQGFTQIKPRRQKPRAQGAGPITLPSNQPTCITRE